MTAFYKNKWNLEQKTIRIVPQKIPGGNKIQVLGKAGFKIQKKKKKPLQLRKANLKNWNHEEFNFLGETGPYA